MFYHELALKIRFQFWIFWITLSSMAVRQITVTTLENWNRIYEVRIFRGAKGAGNSVCQLSKVGLCLSRLPSTQKAGSLPTKLGVKWVCAAKYQILLFIKLSLERIFTKNIQRWSIIFCITGDLLWALKIGPYCRKICALVWVCGAKKKRKKTLVRSINWKQSQTVRSGEEFTKI